MKIRGPFKASADEQAQREEECGERAFLAEDREQRPCAFREGTGAGVSGRSSVS